MKKFFLIFLTALIFLAMPVFSASHYDETAVVYEDDQIVVFSGTIAFTGDGTGTFYTKGLLISDCLYSHSFAVAWTNAIALDDVNMYVEYSRDLYTWKAGMVSSGQVFDDIHDGTVQADTIDVTGGVTDVLAKSSIWTRLKFIGQTGNPVTATVTWYATFTKTEKGGKKIGTARVRSRVT